MFTAYLNQNDHLNALVQAYMGRLSGVDALQDHVIEPPEIRHARLLAGATFLMIDIVNAGAFRDEQAASDKRLLKAFESQFNGEL